MSDFGGKLRLARERRGISLREIAATTKISITALEALERNDISKLPGGIFSRSFVRSYAIEVGLDPDETVREFLERFQGPASPAPQVHAPIPDEESAFESQQRIAGVVLKLVLISIPLIVLILYLTMRTRGAGPSASVAPPPPPAATASPAPDSATSASPAPPPGTPPAAIVGTAGAERGAPPTKGLTLELHPTGTCWIRLTVDGKKILEREMRAGEKATQEMRDTAIIDVGDAGAFAFSIDGRPGKSLGEAGKVRTARITRETVAQYLQ